MGKIVSNLPNDSQPWGRDIEARIEQLEALVASNEINNAARDQRLETNLSKVSELLANTAALRTYQAQNQSFGTYAFTSSDTEIINTTDLVVNFSIDKERFVFFEYATDFATVVTYTSSGDLTVQSVIFSEILLNGNLISLSTQNSIEQFSAANPYQSKTSSGTHRNIEKIRLQAGDYQVTVKLTAVNESSSSTATMTFGGDVLSVSIIE